MLLSGPNNICTSDPLPERCEHGFPWWMSDCGRVCSLGCYPGSWGFSFSPLGHPAGDDESSPAVLPRSSWTGHSPQDTAAVPLRYVDAPATDEHTHNKYEAPLSGIYHCDTKTTVVNLEFPEKHVALLWIPVKILKKKLMMQINWEWIQSLRIRSLQSRLFNRLVSKMLSWPLQALTHFLTTLCYMGQQRRLFTQAFVHKSSFTLNLYFLQTRANRLKTGHTLWWGGLMPCWEAVNHKNFDWPLFYSSHTLATWMQVASATHQPLTNS